ncbi:MAG: DNA-binding protein [Nitrososphaerota archaeon]
MDESSIKFKRKNSRGKLLMADMDLAVTSIITDEKAGFHKNVFIIRNENVMKNVLEVMELFGKAGDVIIKAKGTTIPTAVAVANIITEKMLKGNSRIQNITVDSEIPDGIGKMLSTIEIILSK